MLVDFDDILIFLVPSAEFWTCFAVTNTSVDCYSTSRSPDCVLYFPVCISRLIDAPNDKPFRGSDALLTDFSIPFFLLN